MRNEATLQAPILAVIGPDVVPDLHGTVTVGQYLPEPETTAPNFKIGLRIGLNTLFEATLTAAQMRKIADFIKSLLRTGATFPENVGDYIQFDPV